VRIEVAYTGVPENLQPAAALGGWYSPGRGALALGEPEIAVLWYPSNDHPRDKATFDISVRVPRGVEAISNGSLTKGDVQDGHRVWHWQVDAPMATYLAFLAIGQYEVEQGTSPSGLPYLNAFASQLGDRFEAYAKRSVRATPLIAEWESGIFGPYPFEQLGGVIPPFRLFFALENQTRPVYSKYFFRQRTNTYVIVHEIAHQWYGDSVSVHNWKDIWLNEGFATYAEWLWASYTDFVRPNQSFRMAYNWFGKGSWFWKLEVGDPGPKDLFHFAVYLRGAMTLQAIRNVVGREDFGRTLRTWARIKAGSNGTTLEFRRLAEQISGEDLRHIFKVWLHTETRPAPTAANGYPVRGDRALTSRDRASIVSMLRSTKQLAQAEREQFAAD
jgi:aminopeptidase N